MQGHSFSDTFTSLLRPAQGTKSEFAKGREAAIEEALEDASSSELKWYTRELQQELVCVSLELSALKRDAKIA